MPKQILKAINKFLIFYCLLDDVKMDRLQFTIFIFIYLKRIIINLIVSGN